MATVRKRKWTHNGKDREAWVINYTDQGGKRRQETFEKKKDADRRRIEIENEIEQGTHTAAGESVTVAEAVDEFIRHCERRRRIGDLTGNGLRGYQYRLDLHVKGRFGRIRISDLRSEQVQEYMDELSLRLAAKSVLNIHQALVVLLSFALSRKWVKRNILRDERTRLPKTSKRADIPTRADLVALLDAAEQMEPKDNLLTHLNRRLVVNLALFGGLRAGEIYGLQWESIDFAHNVIRVRHSFSVFDGLKGPKSAAGNRDVPLTQPIYRALSDVALYWSFRDQNEADGGTPERLRAEWDRRDEKRTEIAPRSGYVILSKSLKPTHNSKNNKFWPPLMKRAGLYDHATGKNKFTLHALRHAAASLLIEAGLPAMNLKTVIGHASSSTTFDVYGHLFPDDQRVSEAANAIALALDATREQQNSVTR